MKKLICFVIVFSMLIASCICTTVTANAKYDDSLYASKYDALNSLGILPDSFSQKLMTDKATYGDFASFVTKLTGYEELASAIIIFNDDNKSTCIEYTDAAKILLSLLGWNADYINKEVTYLAKSNNLNDNIVSIDEFCVYDAVVMMYNSLTAQMLEQTEFGDKSRYQKTDLTLAEMYKNAYYFEGILSANKFGTISDDFDVGDDHVVIQDEQYGILDMKYTGIDTYFMLGAKVQGFYIKNNGVKTLVCISKADSIDEKEITRVNKPYYNKSKNQIEYYENNKLKTEKIDFAAEVVYNGQYVESDVTDILGRINDVKYSLEKIVLTDNDNNGKYDLVSMSIYTNAIVEGKSKTDFRLYCKSGQFLSYKDIEEKGLIFVEKSDYTPATYEDIKPEQTISIFEGLSEEKCVRMVINDQKLLGKLVSKSESGHNYTVCGLKIYDEQDATVEAKKENYEFANESDAGNVRIGETYDIYVDFNGCIAYAIVAESVKKNYGLFVKMAPFDDGLQGKKIKALIMTDLANAQSPMLETVELAKNVLLDGKKIASDNLDVLNRELFHTVVTYYTTSDGKIREFVSADSGSDDALVSKNRPEAVENETSLPNIKKLMFIKNPCVMFQNTDANVKSGEGHFNISFAKNNKYSTGLVPFNDVRVICVPDITISSADDTYRDTFYKVLPIETTEYFHNTSLAVYKITGYYKQGEVNPSFVVYTRAVDDKPESYKEATWHDRILLVNTVSKVTNPTFGNPCLKISGIYGGEKLDFYTKAQGVRDYSGESSYVDVGDGDLLFVSFDPNGYITYGLKFYDFDTETKDGELADFISDGTNYEMYRGYDNVSETFARYIFMKGFVYNEGVSNSGITLADDYDAMENDGKYGGLYGFGSPIKHIYCFDTEYDKTPEKRVNVASLNSGICYYEDKEHTSKVVIRMRAGNTMDVIIYR